MDLKLYRKNAIQWVGIRIDPDLSNGAAVMFGANKLSLTNEKGAFCKRLVH
jgi:hypothetical protein